jgi:hypothetical protein
MCGYTLLPDGICAEKRENAEPGKDDPGASVGTEQVGHDRDGIDQQILM